MQDCKNVRKDGVRLQVGAPLSLSSGTERTLTGRAGSWHTEDLAGQNSQFRIRITMWNWGDLYIYTVVFVRYTIRISRWPRYSLCGDKSSTSSTDSTPLGVGTNLVTPSPLASTLTSSLLLNLPARPTQTIRLQLVLNSAARTVTKTPTSILKSLHWLKIWLAGHPIAIT